MGSGVAFGAEAESQVLDDGLARHRHRHSGGGHAQRALVLD